MRKSHNNKELVRVGHEFAKAMGADTPIIEIAKMMSRLAERLDCTSAALRETQKQRDASEQAERVWEEAMMQACGEDGPKSVAEKFSELQAKCAALAAENAALKSGTAYFSYGSEHYFECHKTKEAAVEAAEAAIEDYRGDACDGWSEEVDSVCWGVIMQTSTKIGERPRTEEDSCDPSINTVCDYALLPNIETPATDAFLAELRNEAGARAVELFAQTLGSPYSVRDEKCYEDGFTRAIEVVRDAQAPRFAAQLRQVGAE